MTCSGKNPASRRSAHHAFSRRRRRGARSRIFPARHRGEQGACRRPARIGICERREAAALARELDALGADFRSGAFVLDERYEDGHSAIEARLTERLGDAGRKVHTGRSRNDQILVATRLWLKDKSGRTRSRSAAISRASASIVPRAKRCRCRATRICSARSCRRPRCGSPVSPKASSTMRVRARETRDWIDANPLGTAAGYGVNLPARSRPHDAGARLRAHAGLAGLRATLARQVRDRRARCARLRPCSICAAWPGT